jgi:hypothetical protein
VSKIFGGHGYVQTVSTANVTGINQWSLDYTVDPLESTDFSASGVATYITGVSRWSGTFSGYKDGIPIALTGATVSLVLAESSVTNWTGLAFITGIHPANTFDGLVSYSYDYTGTGTLTTSSA